MLRYLDQGAPLVGLVLAVLVGFLGHNLSQAWTARALGDHTAIRAGYGRVGREQFDVLGVIASVLTVFAWGFAAPVPLDVRQRRRPRTAAALLAGPAFLLALTVAVAAAQSGHPGPFVDGALSYGEIGAAGLFVTSMIPIPPLALGRALWMWAPATGGWASARYRLEQESLGRLVAFAILMLPVIFVSLPDPVSELAAPLVRRFSQTFAG